MPLPEPMVLSSFLQIVLDGLKERRLPIQTLIRRCAIPQSWLDDPYAEIPLRRYIELFEEAARVAENPDFGLSLGRAATPYNLGPVGLLFASSADLGRALHSLSTHVGVVQDRTHSCLRMEDQRAFFEYRIDDDRIRQRRQDAEFSLSMVCQMVRFITGKDWVPEEVHFEHPRPANIASHAALFRCPLYFDQPSNAVVLVRSDLSLRNPQMDERMAALFLHHVAMMRGQQGERRNMGDQVRSLLRNHLPSNDGIPTVEKAAAATGMSVRTLQRVLKNESSGFRAIKDEERRHLAYQYLGQTSKPITEIGLMLGYADPACFTRACQRWFALSPRKLRQSLRDAADEQKAPLPD